MKRKLVQFGIAAMVGSVAVLLGARLATATVPDANGAVHGCLKSNGQVYVIDPSTGQTCGKDIPLDWNKTGATGSQGVDGPKGYTGFGGTTGSSGYERRMTRRRPTAAETARPRPTAPAARSRLPAGTS